MTAATTPDVAGTYFPADPDELHETVRTLLSAPRHQLSEDADPDIDRPVAAVLVPHSSYSRSGQVAAVAYARLERTHPAVRRVVLLGPSHHVTLRGLALPAGTSISTPAGEVPIDADAVRELTATTPSGASRCPQVAINAQAHTGEHSLVVQLPLLQQVLGPFTVVPLVVGRATPAEIADLLDLLVTDPSTVVVVTTDLSRHLRYEDARAVDEVTIAQIVGSHGALNHEQACGASPVNGLTLWAVRHRLSPRLLGQSCSSAAGDDSSRVVGHAAIAYTRKDHDSW
ncbi:AmmeMemoRadiSam system protein B [Austwickia sp. TVS 96-490-7B]|uniref:AmmeMemoRadiSam system protein B n=1 Tax=Austwickia sp. TVS 96-490-7B TaxID=2830843 RepID=UPI001C5A496C|nr:AmmeMemoRadiSam system protein B [Austwickia sp. TVS 96-490-7B]